LAFSEDGKATHSKFGREDGPKKLPESCAILLGKKGWMTVIPYVPEAVMLKMRDVSL